MRAQVLKLLAELRATGRPTVPMIAYRLGVCEATVYNIAARERKAAEHG
jgi:hypothetical protein